MRMVSLQWFSNGKQICPSYSFLCGFNLDFLTKKSLEASATRFWYFSFFMAVSICFYIYQVRIKEQLKQNKTPGASLVAQWLRICLPMQGTRVRALVWEDPTCRGATRPVSHNY